MRKHSNYYSDIYKYYDKITSKKDDRKSFIKVINDVADKGNSILEVGVGTAETIIELSKKGFDVAGLDISEEMLREARKKCKHINKDIELVYGSLEDTDLNKNFDITFSFGGPIFLGHRDNKLVGIYYSPNKDIRDAAEGIKRLTCNSGTFVCNIDTERFGKKTINVNNLLYERYEKKVDRHTGIVRHCVNDKVNSNKVLEQYVVKYLEIEKLSLIISGNKSSVEIRKGSAIFKV